MSGIWIAPGEKFVAEIHCPIHGKIQITAEPKNGAFIEQVTSCPFFHGSAVTKVRFLIKQSTAAGDKHA